MSEGRQILLLLLGGLVLAGLGVVAGTAFPEPCEEIEGIGSLELTFVSPSAALGLPADTAAAVEKVGDELGIGPFRGAVVLPAGTELLPTDFGFFAVTDTDLVALRPSSARGSAPRDVTGLEVVPVASTSAGLVTPDDEIAVIASDYERERCGSLPAGSDVLAIDRGFALLRTGESSAALRALSGDELWEREFPGSISAGAIVADSVLVATSARVEFTSLREGEGTGSVETPNAAVLSSDHGSVLVVADAAETDGAEGSDRLLKQVGVSERGGVSVTEFRQLAGVGDGALLVDAATTPAGLVAITASALVTDRDGSAELPAGVVPTELVTSQDGQVGVVVPGPSGDPVLLVWGRDNDGADVEESPES